MEVDEEKIRMRLSLFQKIYVGVCVLFIFCAWYLLIYYYCDFLVNGKFLLGENENVESYLKYETRDLIHMKPPTFLPQFKNPCFYEQDDDKRQIEDNIIRCLPYFMVIGVAKCGTTDIFQSIVGHPDVIKGKHKEAHFWAKCRSCKIYKDQNWCNKCSKSKRPTTWDEYLDYFQPLSTFLQREERHGTKNSINRPLVQITGDGTPSTIWDHRWWWAYPDNKYDGNPPSLLNAHYLKRFLPDVKLIITIREPAERLYSNYAMICRHNNIEPSPIDFHSTLQKKINLFNECRSKYTLRYCAYSLPSATTVYGLLEKGLYVVFIRDWLKVFPRDQVMVIQLEEYSKNKPEFMKKIYKFLGLRDVYVPFNVENTKKHSHGMLNVSRALLKEFYAPYNKELAEFLNDEKFLWG